MRVGNAPIKENLTDAQANPAWQQWFAAVGTAVAGEWSSRSLSSGKCAIAGGVLVVSFDWTAYPGPTTIDLPVQVESGVLCFVDGNGNFLTAGLVSGSTIAVPSNAHTGRTIATGSFVVKR
jgi:hypothetical protein